MTVSYSIADIAKRINAQVFGDERLQITGLAPIASAKSSELTYFLGGRYQTYLPKTQAAAVILSEKDRSLCPCTALVVDNPELAFAKIAALFDSYKKPSSGMHPTAVIAQTAVIGDGATIGPHCVIGENVVIGKNTILTSGVIVGDHVTIGDDCLFYPHVTLYHAVSIGHRVTVHAGAVIGADGFGLTRSKAGWEKIPQIGRVIIHDDVDVGANTCIDRGALVDTVIHKGVKIDNQVQIAHNVVVGAHTVIAGCVGIAGSTVIGKNCMIGGAVNINGHLNICDGAVFTGNAMVTKSIDQPGIYSSGTGIYENTKWRKMVVRLRQLDQFIRSVGAQ